MCWALLRDLWEGLGAPVWNPLLVGAVWLPHIPFEPLSDLVISIFHSALTSLLSRGERGIAAPTQLWNKHFFVLTTQGSVQTWRLCRAGLHTQSPRTDKRKREKGTVTCPCLGSLRLPEILLTPSTRLPGKRNLIHLIHRLCPLALRGNYTWSCLGSWRQNVPDWQQRLASMLLLLDPGSWPGGKNSSQDLTCGVWNNHVDVRK